MTNYLLGTYDVGYSCHDIQASQGATKSGIYLIHPSNLSQGPWKVYCDFQTEGGGWMVFQVRDDVKPRENFMRNWEDYKVGFGDFDREFWLGKEIKPYRKFAKIFLAVAIVSKTG